MGNMRGPRTIATLAAVAATGVIGALAATSCSKSTPESGETGAAGAATGGGPRVGGYIILPSPEPKIINPVLQTAFDLATPLIYEGLVGLDAKLEPVPVLAEKWERSPDGKVLSFTIRQGVKWQDGTPFTSADVAFTIDAIRKAPTSIWSGYLASIDKVDAKDPQVLAVTYKEPYGPDVVSFTFGVLPKHLYEGKDLAKAPTNVTPVGTGPYKVLRWTPNKGMVLEANKAHWAGRPNIDQIELLFDVQQKDNLAKLRANKLDFAEIIEPAEWSGVLRTPEFLERFEAGTTDELTLNLISWNNQKKPFDDRRVRVALTQALDRPRVIEDVLGGAAHRLSGPFYPNLWGADPNIAPWPFDLAAAEKLLDEAGLPKKNGKRFPINLLVEDRKRGVSLYDSQLAIFRDDLGKIGVDLNVTYLPRQELVDRLLLHNFEAVLFEFTADIADPDPYAMLHSSQVNAGENFAGYVNPDVDKLLEAGRRTLDRGKRKEAYFALHKLVHEDEPYSFLFARQRYYAWGRRVHGVSPLDVSSMVRWPGVARWWVDK
jgi:peptide/nickel transport system substrate-binding protein